MIKKYELASIIKDFLEDLNGKLSKPKYEDGKVPYMKHLLQRIIMAI